MYNILKMCKDDGWHHTFTIIQQINHNIPFVKDNCDLFDEIRFEIFL